MPKEKSIGVSKETLAMLKSFKEGIGVKSLESAIRLAIGWAKSYHDFGLSPQMEMADKIEDIEVRLKTIEKIFYKALKEANKKLQKGD